MIAMGGDIWFALAVVLSADIILSISCFFLVVMNYDFCLAVLENVGIKITVYDNQCHVYFVDLLAENSFIY